MEEIPRMKIKDSFRIIVVHPTLGDHLISLKALGSVL